MTESDKILEMFGIAGKISGIFRIPEGKINRTFKIDLDSGEEYILQEMNQYVFPEPEKVMHNHLKVSAYLEKKSLPAIQFQQTLEGKYLFRNWRMMKFFHGESRKRFLFPEELQQGGEMFGKIAQALSEMDGTELEEILPEFHDTEKYYAKMEEFASDIPEYKILEEWKEYACYVCRTYREQEIPLKVVHGDMKCSNLLFHPETNEAVAVIDFDTVMNGKTVYDFGDAVRSAATEILPKEVFINQERYRIFVSHWLKQVHYSEQEKKLLLPSVFAVTVELAVRYLTDYFMGNQYFMITQPMENLYRARSQIKLAKNIIYHYAELEDILWNLQK